MTLRFVSKEKLWFGPLTCWRNPSVFHVEVFFFSWSEKNVFKLNLCPFEELYQINIQGNPRENP